MSSLNKIGLYLVIFFLVGYYGIYPLFGFEVWIRNEGWVQINIKQSLFNICIGLVVFLYVRYFKKGYDK
jgi:hypothetical protein